MQSPKPSGWQLSYNLLWLGSQTAWPTIIWLKLMSSMKTIQANKNKTQNLLIICIHVLSMKRKSFVLRKCYKNNMFTKQKRVQSSYNLFLKNIYIQSMKKIYLYSRWKKKKLILQKFFLLCIVSCRSISSYPSPSFSTSLTDFLHVAVYYS